MQKINRHSKKAFFVSFIAFVFISYIIINDRSDLTSVIKVIWKISRNFSSSISAMGNSSEHAISLPSEMESFKKLQEFCFSNDKSAGHLFQNKFRRSTFNHTHNVVLILVFNTAYFDLMPFLRTLYGPWFTKIVFCGNYPSNFTDGKVSAEFFDTVEETQKYSYVNLTYEEFSVGHFLYICMAKVAELQVKNVDGYLLIGDDVLLNFWNSFDLNKVHLSHTCYVWSTENAWYWWNTGKGLSALQNVNKSLYTLNDSSIITPDMVATLKEVLFIPMKVNADIFYIPQSLIREYAALANLFHQNSVFLELAVPRILSALGWSNFFKQCYNNETMDKDFEGKYLWFSKRVDPFLAYNKNHMFLHPLKMSRLKEYIWKKHFCDSYVRDMFQTVWEQ